MHLQTTLIISSGNCSIKTNHRSQFSNFSHPLKVLQKTDNQMLEMIRHQQQKAQNVFDFMIKGSDGTKINIKEKQRNLNASKDHNSKSKKSQYFNEDEGILQHIHKSLHSPPNTPQMKHVPFQARSTKQCKYLTNKLSTNQSKCFILFGFSINLLEIQNFHDSHPQLNLSIKLYQYGENEYFKEIEIKSLQEESIQENPSKYRKIIDALNGEDLLDCQEVSFVVSFWQNEDGISESEINSPPLKNKPKTYVYFFPNINALKSDDQRRQQKTHLTLGLPFSSTNHYRQNSIATNAPESFRQTMTSLRKSHQNFRILQVLEYYLKLQCHSQHIMITSNESRIIKEFLDLIYECQIKDFYVYIDHERKSHNRTSKSTARSIFGNKHTNKDHCVMSSQQQNGRQQASYFHHGGNYDEKINDSPPSSKVYTSDICSQKQFISIDGQLIINDEFLSKLSELKLPEPWLDNTEFREQKKLMYKMKLQEYTQNKQIKKMKNQFTDTINYLNSLIGLQKVTYDQISIQSLKVIKNAKIRQATQQVKELENISQEKQIRNQQLKQKIKQYENERNSKNQNHQQRLSHLRKDILTVQKQLNLHRNQLNAIYHMDEGKMTKESTDTKSNVLILEENKKDTPTNIRSSKQNDSSKLFQKSKVSKVAPQSVLRNQKSSTLQPKINIMQQKRKNLNQTSIPTQQKQQKCPQSQTNIKNSRISVLKGILPNSKSPIRVQSFLMNRRSSQLLSKYAPILQQLRKQKYEQSLKQEMTKCEFQAQKEFEKYKEEYTKALKELRMVLNDCD